MREIKVGDELLYNTTGRNAIGAKYKFHITQIKPTGNIFFNYYRLDRGRDKGTTSWAQSSLKEALEQGRLIFLNQILIEDDPEYSDLFV